MGRTDLWWRVGYAEAPLDFVPHALYSWNNRFDDIEREYRTVYCAERKITCLREVLAPLRPNTKVRAAFAQFQKAQGIEPHEMCQPSRDVTPKWRESHSLVRARAVHDAPFADLEDVQLRQALERQFAELLEEHGMLHLDISDVRSTNRVVTQTISRDLYNQGVAGLLFASNIDDSRCLAVMEGRASLEAHGDPTSLLEDVPELLDVCAEFGLFLAPGAHNGSS